MARNGKNSRRIEIEPRTPTYEDRRFEIPAAQIEKGHSLKVGSCDWRDDVGGCSNV